MAAAAMCTFVSCEKNENNNGEPAGPGEPTGPDAVASDALVAYFPFESAESTVTLGEGISFAGVTGDGTFAAARKGNGYQGTDGAYMTFNVAENNPFADMKEFTIAFWMRSPILAAQAAPIFLLDGGDSGQGGINVTLESGSDNEGLDMKFYLYNTKTEWMGQDLRIKNEAFPVDRWYHLVASYDAETSTMSLYSNATLVSSSVRYAGPDPTADDDPSDQPLLGELTLGAPSHIYVGVWPGYLAGGSDSWMGFYPGMLDELRIYNKALSEDEIKALYNAEIEVMD